MKTDSVFILAAGHGTRMGDVGKVIPKPAFPIFNKTLIEVLIIQLKELGFKNFYVNTHHRADYLKSHLANVSPEVVVLHEENLLGSGGAFYNLKSNFPDLKNIFSVNSDLIFNLTKKNLLDLEKTHDKTKASVTLLGLNVKGRKGFNRLNVEGNLLKNIISSSDLNAKLYDYTYSGMGIFNLEHLDNHFSGIESTFFDSVAPFQKKSIAVHLPKGIDYYDFGTLKSYLKSIKMIRDDRSSFVRKYLSLDIFKENKGSFVYKNDLVEVTVGENDLRLKLKS